MWSFADTCSVAKTLRCSMHMFPPEVKQDNALPSYFRSHDVNKHIFGSLFSGMFFPHFSAFCWWFYCLKWPHHRAKVLPSFPKCKKAAMCLTEKNMCVGQAWVLLPMSLVLMSQQHILNKVCFNKSMNKTRLYIDLLMEMLQPAAVET